MITASIEQLIRYGLQKQLIQPADMTFIRNQYLALYGLDEPEPCVCSAELPPLCDILKNLLDAACERGICADTTAARDRFDTALMGILTARPSEVIAQFSRDYAISPKQATDRFYQFCYACDYIRGYRIEKDVQWKTDTVYGALDITINLSKPEKDPRDIAAAKTARTANYPRCLLCRENEGYAGRADHPARQNLRVIPIEISGEAWGFQYSPYVYYNEHCIVLNQKHIPMVIDDNVFAKLFDFVRQFPHYFVGSNADLPIVGGSILAHEHFQGGNYEFAMAKAPIEKTFCLPGFEDLTVGRVAWPMSVIRLRHSDANLLCRAAAHMLHAWRAYTDANAFIFAETDGEPHNTITPIARKRGVQYELDLVLRNNITTSEHPMGVFHPHAELHNIKKENIGLIEVMGLAVLPSRLKAEMEALKEAIVSGTDYHTIEMLHKHAAWADAWITRCAGANALGIQAVIEEEIGKTFATVLEHAGVFKRDSAGLQAFDRFIASL